MYFLKKRVCCCTLFVNAGASLTVKRKQTVCDNAVLSDVLTHVTMVCLYCSNEEALSSAHKQVALLRDMTSQLEQAVAAGDKQQQLMQEDFKQTEAMWSSQLQELQKVSVSAFVQRQ